MELYQGDANCETYGAEMKQQGVDDVWRYGIAFCGKRVWMAGE